MAKDQRYFVDVCLEIYVPDQGCGDKALTNESKDANWFANEIVSQIPRLVNKQFQFSERPYSVGDASFVKQQRG